MLATSAACVVALALLYLFAVRTGLGQHLDDDALLGRSLNPRVQHASSRLLRSIDVFSLALVGGAIVVLALIRARAHLALAVATLIGGAIATTEALKHLLARPELSGPDRLPTPSFPSGHTAVAASLALGLVLVVPARWRGPVALAGSAYAVSVGAATVTAGGHRPSDVVGAFLVTIAWVAAVCAALLAWAPARRTPRPPTGRAAVALLGLAAVLLGAVAVAVALTVAALRDRDLHPVPVGASYAGSIVAIAASGAGLVAVLLGVLGGGELEPEPDLTGLRHRVIVRH